jgi:ATP-binding cassette, subfamily B, bacterial HlyB/CyaB
MFSRRRRADATLGKVVESLATPSSDGPTDLPSAVPGVPTPSAPSKANVDGGLLSLAIACKLLGVACDIEAMRREYLPSGAPARSDDLLRVARSLGFKARVAQTSARRLSKVALPIIALQRGGGFIVIAKHTAEGVVVGVNGGAPELWPLKRLKSVWRGKAIFIARRDQLTGETLSFGLRWFWPVVKRFRWVLAEVLLVSIFIQLIALVAPLFSQVVIDKVIVHRGLTTLQVLVIGLLIINVVDALLSWLRTYTFSHTTSRMDAILGAVLFKHLMALPIGYFETRPAGQTVARVRELENVRQFLTGSALTLIIDILFSGIFIFVMWMYSPLLTWIVIGSIPAYLLVSISITPALKSRVQEKFKRGAANQSMLVESLAGIQTLKAMAVEPQSRQRWEEQLAGYVGSSLRVITLGAAGSQLVGLIGKITSAALLWFGAQMVIAGGMTIGAFVAFNMLAGQISGPILRLAQLWQDFQQFKLSIDRLGDIINTQTELAPSANRLNPPQLKGHIRFDDVGFRYRADGQQILKALSLEIAAGEVVGIVGRSGSGKSTLTKLLQRLYIPEHGRVIVDGIDINLVDPSWLRRQIGVVLQENVLFNRTIHENIALSDPTLSVEQVMEAARMAGAHDFIVELPQGYNTLLEERGSNLSGGQRQRIAIARALVVNPRILILDEATSALDYESERIIQHNMRTICQGRTVLIVAHRLSTVRQANRILVIEKGSLAESGNHDELLARKGIYAQLVSQAAG